MDRGASAAFLTELGLPANRPCFLVDIYFDGSTVRYTDAFKDLVSGGNTYTASGHLLSIGGIAESADMTIPSISVTVSGIDQSWISILLSTLYLDRRLVISKAFIDGTTGLLTVTPIAVFDGRMDGMSLSDNPDSGNSTVTINATNHWTDFEFRPGRHTNSVEHEFLFPADKFFEFTSDMGKDIVWGVK